MGLTHTESPILTEHLAAFKDGTNLDASELDRLLSQKEKGNAELIRRIKLTGYYSRHGGDKQTQFTEQLKWLIMHYSNQPLIDMIQQNFQGSDPDTLNELRTTWKEAMAASPEQVDVLANAASFFSDYFPEEALAIYHKIQTLQPSRSKWPRLLSDTSKNLARGCNTENEIKYAHDSVKFGLNALDLYDANHDDSYLQIYQTGFIFELGELALGAGMANEAAQLGKRLIHLPTTTELVQKHDGTETSVVLNAYGPHFGNSLLGRLEKLKGNIPAAIGFLEHMETQLIPDSPDISLADELRDDNPTAVNHYVETCIKSLQSRLRALGNKQHVDTRVSLRQSQNLQATIDWLKRWSIDNDE